VSDRPEVWTITGAQSHALHRQIQRAFDRISDAPYETVRKKPIRFAVLRSVEIPPGDPVISSPSGWKRPSASKSRSTVSTGARVLPTRR
jgi:hypothetical protein